MFNGAMDARRGTVRLDTTSIGADTFADWPAQIGDHYPMPAFTLDTSGRPHIRGRASRIGDVAVMDLHTTTRVRTGGPFTDTGELRLYAVRRGDWVFRHDRVVLPVRAGRFLLRRSTGLDGFEVAARTGASVVSLPAGAIGATGADPQVSGDLGTPEVRLLLAHADLLHETLGTLTDAGALAARNALVELGRGVLHRYVDGAEPELMPALVRAARDLADRRLTDPDLTPESLAGRLHVSVRTLQRAFGTTGETVSAYIRRRRLDEARRALTGPRPPAVSAIAARWQFADSSHFIRAFRGRYGQTPARYAREVPAHAPEGRWHVTGM